MAKYSNVSIKQLVYPGGIDDALKVRIAVFVDEQKYTLESELDKWVQIENHNQHGQMLNNAINY